MRNALFLIVSLILSCNSWAGTSLTAWENLSALHAGEKIQVVEMNSKRVSGTFLDVADKEISLQEGSAQRTIRMEDVREVMLSKHAHRLRNTLIFGAVGAGVGAGIGAAAHHGCSPQSFCLDIGGRGLPAAVGAVIGFAGGAILGALVPSHKTIYRAPAH